MEYLRLGLHVHVGQPCLSKTLPKGQWTIHTGPQIGLIGMAKKEANYNKEIIYQISVT